MPSDTKMLLKFGHLIRDAWLVVGITLLMFCLIESGLTFAIFLKHQVGGSEGSSVDDRRPGADAHSGQSWVGQYYKEWHHSNKAEWRPYVYWRRAPFRGEYINVDSNGLRLTMEPAVSGESDSRVVRIFMFGGSTLWGTAARDAFTIPSLLALELQHKGLRSEITNFGESGHVSTQEVLTLILQLQRGHRPDLVVFYDGINDTYSAYQQHVAGLPQNEFHRIEEFNLTHPDSFGRRRTLFLRDISQRLRSVSALRTLLARPDAASGSAAAVSLLPERLRSGYGSSGEAVVTTYKSNMEVVKALGDYYHFNYLFYWQPTIFQKAYLTTFERAERDSAQDQAGFFAETYAAVQNRGVFKGEAAFHDLSLVFSDVRDPIYVDWAHPAELGNAIIAKAMVSHVVDIMQASATRHRPETGWPRAPSAPVARYAAATDPYVSAPPRGGGRKSRRAQGSTRIGGIWHHD